MTPKKQPFLNLNIPHIENINEISHACSSPVHWRQCSKPACSKTFTKFNWQGSLET